MKLFVTDAKTDRPVFEANLETVLYFFHMYFKSYDFQTRTFHVKNSKGKLFFIVSYSQETGINMVPQITDI